MTHISFEENSAIEFKNNIATQNGGAIYCYATNISFSEYSTVIFRNNIGDYGGALFAEANSNIIFSDNSMIIFITNWATFGATVYSNINTKIMARENFTIIFDDHSAKWCTNTCLPYTGQSDVVTIDGNGIVWCSNQKYFICLSIKCYCKNLKDILNETVIRRDPIVNITDEGMILSSFIELHLYDISFSLIGHNNLTVICVNGGRLSVYLYNDITTTIEGINWIGCGGYRNIITPVIQIFSNLTSGGIKIQKCSFQHSIAPAIGTLLHPLFLEDQVFNITINHCIFMNNNLYSGHGAAIYYSLSSNNTITVNNCNFSYNDRASLIYIINGNTIYINNSSFYNNQGVPIHLTNYVKLQIYGKVSFENNVADNGAGIYVSDHSTITFDKNLTVKFNNNTAINGSIYSKASSNVTFKENCKVTFSNNSATQYGAAIYSSDNSHVTVTGKSEVTFSNNDVSVSESNVDRQFGGTFQENSNTTFYNNIANFDAAIFLFYNSNILFKDKSRVIFINNNKVINGTIYSKVSSNVTFKGNCEVTFNNNSATQYGAAIYSSDNSHVTFTGNSVVTFTSNDASLSKSDADHQFGGTIFSENNGHVSFEENCTTMYYNNIANFGAAIFSFYNSNILFKGKSRVIFNGNIAQTCGTLASAFFSNVTFNDNTNVTFNNNAISCAFRTYFEPFAGAICTFKGTNILFSGHSFIRFFNNKAERVEL